ncbi:MAG: ABC transporter ATP-binding protein [Acidaminococcaceae bacterium]
MIKRFLPYYKPYITTVVLIIVGSLLLSSLELLFPLVLRYVMNTIIPKGELSDLYLYSGILLGLYCLGYFLNYIVTYYGHFMGAKIENDMRHALFKHLESLSFRYFDNSKTGQLMSRITSDIAEIGELSFRGPNDIIVCTLTMTGTIVILFFMNWKLAIFITILLLVKTFETIFTNRKMKASFKLNRVRAGEISAQVEDSLAGIRVVKAFTNEEFELQKFSKVSNALLDARAASYKILARFSSGISFFSSIINVAMLVIGGTMIATGQLPVSDFVAFFLYVGSIFMKPVLRLTVFTEMYQRGMAGFARFCEIMDDNPDFADAPDAINCERLHGNILFKDVTFSYDHSSKVINNINLNIKAGEIIAFVGPTGVGKTTICNLIPRFYDVQNGAIYIDGIDIKKITLESLRSNIGIVQQDVFIFSENVHDNIAYGRIDAEEDEVIAAAKAAEAHEFIVSLPDGYDTNIGERGVKLSGGQKQRISIARIFLKNPPILILDEATSALDNETEKKIQRALNSLSKNRTTLIIAHRLATVQKADRIVVLTDRGIIEQGKHEALLAKKGVYYDLYQAQFTDITSK